MSNTYTSIEFNARLVFEGNVAEEFLVKFNKLTNEMKLLNGKGNELTGEVADFQVSEMLTFTDNEEDEEVYHVKDGEEREVSK